MLLVVECACVALLFRDFIPCDVMPEDLAPSRVVAILPILSRQGTRKQAEVSLGLACFLHRRFSRVTGLAALLPQPVDSPKQPGAPEESVEDIFPPPTFRLPLNSPRPTHILRGACKWDEQDQLKLTLEVIDPAASARVFREEVTIAPNREGLEGLSRLLGALGHCITESEELARLLSRLPTLSTRAFHLYLAGLAAAESWRNGLADSERSFSYLLAALELDPQLHDALLALDELVLGCVEEGDEDEEAARRALLKGTRLLPAEPLLAGRLGLLLDRRGREAEARPHLERTLELAPAGELAPDALVALAKIDTERGDLGGARRRLFRALHLRSDVPERWEMLARLCERLEDWSEAEAYWRRALQEDAERPKAMIHLARCMLRRGDKGGALVLLRRVRKAPPADAPSRRLLVESLLEAGGADDANELATGWAETAPECFAAWMALAHVRDDLGHRDGARFALARARETEAFEPEEWEPLALRHGLVEPPAAPDAPQALSPVPARPSARREAPRAPIPPLPAAEPAVTPGLLRQLLSSMKSLLRRSPGKKMER